ncbi:2-vinyl bacteriochlorophyllide hydratase [Polynucleobacter sp. SHI8]|uniref:2-vinyl bacteriochlorophyllide hydratase n=1 Tax=unclassified Polynucleobacter TaxID=2640945 RepID=UPI002490A3B2|nr:MULTISPECIES: 2-vinyl bacteriochlorophyllide hydratase [unclassified Polynucleobacter]BDW11839.1 2-vinyl bacteriochlorophyllide hydratase [Polynucleobacter sp. SHI2]BDW14286.1 2-vinyl bacteriochlorophyllide hydratase [Polynucleobacter sp. SHI8]
MSEKSKLLYTPEQRIKRDNSVWTLVQGVLAPLQFLVFLVSITLVIRFLLSGKDYEIANYSILLKTFFLLIIMITGCIWEKVVFDKYLFAEAFFWEDVFSMLVIFLHLSYVYCLFTQMLSPQSLMILALCAYVAYFINAAQFIWKLRVARKEYEVLQKTSTYQSPEVFHQGYAS